MGKRVLVAAATMGLVVSGLPLVAPAPTASATTGSSTIRLSLNVDAQINGDSRRPSFSGNDAWVAFDTAGTNAVSTTPDDVSLTGFSADTNARRDVVIRNRAAGSPTRIVSVDNLSAQRAADSWDPAVNADGRFVAFLSNGSFGDGNGEGNERPCDDPSPDESAAGQGNEARDLNGALTDVYVRDRDADEKQNIAGSVGVYDQRFLPKQIAGTLPYCGTKTKLVSVGTDELPAEKPSGYRAVQDGSVDISNSGRFVVFATTAKLVTTSRTGVVANQDGDTVLDVYVRDRDIDSDGVYDERDTASTYLVSLPTSGNSTTAGLPTISADGSLIAYEEGASIRVVRLSVANGRPTITTVRTSTDAVTFAGSRPSLGVNAADGAIAYQSGANVEARSIPVNGAVGAERIVGAGVMPQLDDAGTVVAYSVTETGGFQSVRAGSAQGGGTRLISRALGLTTNGDKASGALTVFPEVAVVGDASSGGAIIGFSSDAIKLITGDTNDVRDVFQRGWADLVSVTTIATSQVTAARGVTLTDIPASALALSPGLLSTVVGAPAGGVRSLPSGGVRSLPAGTVRSLPGGGVRSLPGGGVRSLELQSLPLGGIRSLPGGGLRSLPAGAIRSLDITLSQLTLYFGPQAAGVTTPTFTELLEGAPFVDAPLQTVTVADLLDWVDELRNRTTPPLTDNQKVLVSLSLVELDSQGVFLQGVSLASLILGDITLGQLNASRLPERDPIKWCTTLPASLASTYPQLCADDSTVFALELAGGDLSKVDLTAIDASTLPRPAGTAFAAQPAPTAGTPLATYLATFIDPRDVPWEQLSLRQPPSAQNGKLDLEPFARGGLATITSTVVTIGSAPTVVTFTLPAGFAYQPGSATVSTCSGACVPAVTLPAANQVAVAFDSVAGGNVVSIGARPTPLLLGNAVAGPVDSIGGAPVGGTAGVAVRFDGEDAFFGTSPAVQVVDPWAGGRSLDPGTLYFGDIGTVSETDEYSINLPADTPAGTKVTVRLSNLATDLDLTLFVNDPASVGSLPGGGLRSLPAGGVRSLPAGGVRSLPGGGIRSLNGYLRSLPLEDVGSSDPSSLPPEVLQDIPQELGTSYVAALSPNRATRAEVIDTTVGVAAGTQPLRYTVRVTGYNDATGPYALRVVTDPPPFPTAAACAATGDAADLDIFEIAAGTTTLILYPEAGIANKYSGATAGIGGKVTALDEAESALGRSAQVAKVSIKPGFEWGTNESCSPVRANAVAGSISDEIIAMATSGAGAPDLQYVVIIGGDDVLPMARVADNTEISNEVDYANSFGASNPLSRSAAAGRVLTDNIYGDLNPGTIGDSALLVPELAVGRLIETPAQIGEQIDRFVDAGGQLQQNSTRVAAYDFLLDSGDAIADTLGDPKKDLIGNTWRSDDLLTALGADPDVISLNAHYDHQGLLTAAGDKGTLVDGFPDQVGLNQVAGLRSSLIFSVGCHSGLNVPKTYSAAGGFRFLDWADELAPDGVTGDAADDAITALYVANTGFGYGDTEAIALSEQLMSDFAGLIGSYTAGQALVAAKQQYAGGMGGYVSYDEKVLHESTMYGLPMYALPGATPAPAPLAAQSFAAASAPVASGLPTTPAGPGASATLVSSTVSYPNADARPGQQVSNGFPIVPKVQLDVSPVAPADGAELVARGALITGITAQDPVTAPPLYARALVDLKAREQAGSPDEVYFPTTFQTINRIGGPGGGKDSLVLLPGQVRKDVGAAATFTEFSAMQATVFYGPSFGGDVSPPLIDSVSAGRLPATGTANAVVFRVNTSDFESAVWRVVVLYDIGGAWIPIELQKVGGVANEWSGSVQTNIIGGPRFIVQVVNADGRVATATDKGRYYQVTGARPSLATIIRGIEGDNGWYRGGPSGAGTPVLAEIFGPELASFQSTLTRNGGLPVGPTTYTGPVQLRLDNTNDGTFTVLATSNLPASLTTTVKVDGTAPVVGATINGKTLSISAASPTVVPAAGPGVVAATCSDATSLVATSSLAVSSGSVTVNSCNGGAASLNTGFPAGPRTITVSATDNAGNTTSTDFFATILDVSGPTVTITPNALAKNEATGATGANVLVSVSVTVTDNVDRGPFTVVCTKPDGTVVRPDGTSQLFAIGPTVVTCTATDSSRNPGSGTLTVTVQDLSEPTVGVPTTITAEATAAQTPVPFSVSAVDVVDGVLTPTCTTSFGTVVSGSTFPVGTTLVTCTAKDNAGNPGTNSFSVVITDLTSPAFPITLPTNITREASSGAGADVEFTITANDAVTTSPTIACRPASGSTFRVGITPVTCTATDAAGNVATFPFTVTVVDTTPPDLGHPPSLVVEALGSTTTVNFTVPAATDAVTSSPSVTCSPGSGSGFGVGVTNVTCTAPDGSGNIGTATFAVDVRDTTAPTFTSLPSSPLTREATSAVGATVTWTATATDAVTASPTVSCTPASGSVFVIGTTPVSCTATDQRGNSTQRPFDVVVQDTTPPVLTVVNITVDATSASGAVVNYGNSVTATDLVVASLVITCTPPSGSTFPVGTTTVSCTATDGTNISNGGVPQTFTVTVQPFAYTYSGFYSPVNMGNRDAFGFPTVVNGMNAGRTLPLKFEIFNPNGSELTSTTAIDVRILTEAEFRLAFPNLAYPTQNDTRTSLCAGKPVVPLNSVDRSSALKFSGGQYNVGLKTETRPTLPNCYVAFARVATDAKPGITALVQLSP